MQKAETCRKTRTEGPEGPQKAFDGSGVDRGPWPCLVRTVSGIRFRGSVPSIRAAACMPCLVYHINRARLSRAVYAAVLAAVHAFMLPSIYRLQYIPVLPCYYAVLLCYAMPCKALQAAVPCMLINCSMNARKSNIMPCCRACILLFYCAVKRQYKRLVLSFHGTIARDNPRLLTGTILCVISAAVLL